MDPLNQTPNRQTPKDLLEDPEIRSFLNRLDSQTSTFNKFHTNLTGTYSLLLPAITKITVNLQGSTLSQVGEGARPKAVLIISPHSDQSKKVQECAANYLIEKGFEVVTKELSEVQ